MRTIQRSLFILICCVFAPLAALAQTPGATAPAASGNEQLLKPEQLDALVAPIALYPDTLLAEVMMASTYPLEVVEAARWASANKKLKGEQLKAAVAKQAWDDSVKSLVATPDVLEMMNTKLDWTRRLGDAVLAQQADVMDSVQRLRARAQANDKLKTTKQQKVSVRQEQDRQIIAIDPAVPDTLYVPYYDPDVVYGDWPYADYPPYAFAAPSYIPGALLASGLAFGAGYALSRWSGGGNYWGGGVNWGNRNINVNRPVNVNNIGNNWQHNPQHRQGVRYNNASVAQRYGANNLRAGSQQRADFRGRDGVGGGPGQGANLADRGAGSRSNLTDRGGGGRATTGQRSGAQRTAANRPTGGGGRGPRDNALGNVGSGRAANAQAARGRASVGNRSVASLGGPGGGMRAGAGGPRGGAMRAGGGGPRGGAMRAGGGGGFRAAGGGGGFRGGGGGRGGGGRRSDIQLKHDIVRLGTLDNGLGFYRFAYDGSNKAYVGVMAQEVQTVMPEAVSRGRDGYLLVSYDKLGITFQTYAHWVASGAVVPPLRASTVRHQMRRP